MGISKQAVHQYAKRQAQFDQRLQHLVIQADELRRTHPGCGVEKMYYTIKPDFIGRDRFIKTFMALGYRVKHKKNYRKTTIASKLYYPNLIKGLKVNAPNCVWQSDITFIQVGYSFYYAVFIIDIYTKTIVGYKVSDHMRASANVKALEMALNKNKAPQIHHSDRGSQYTYKGYVALLNNNGTKVSMGLSAQDNAYAERINRTIKDEYLNYWKPQSFAQLKRMVHKAVKNYNMRRIHNNLDRLSPTQFQKQWDSLDYTQRPMITIFDNKIS